MARSLSLDELFEGHHSDSGTIMVFVRWYLRFKLTFRDLVEIMAERGPSIAHSYVCQQPLLCMKARPTRIGSRLVSHPS